MISRLHLPTVVPKSEKEFIHEAYTDLYERLSDKIASLRNSLNTALVIKSDGDTEVIDVEAMRMKQEEQATITIDTKKAAEWHGKLLAAIEAWKELARYEKDNKLIETTKLQFHEMTLFGWHISREGTVSEDTFETILRNWLRRK